MHSSAVRSRTFSTGPGGIFAVDSFLSGCADAFEAIERGDAPTLTSHEVLTKRFPRTVVELGYDSDEVDEFLGDVAAILAIQERRNH